MSRPLAIIIVLAMAWAAFDVWYSGSSWCRDLDTCRGAQARFVETVGLP